MEQQSRLHCDLPVTPNTRQSAAGVRRTHMPNVARLVMCVNVLLNISRPAAYATHAPFINASLRPPGPGLTDGKDFNA